MLKDDAFLLRWDENREIFKILIGDALLFLFLLVLLAGAHWVLEFIPVTDVQREFIEIWHFRFTMTIWGLMFIVMVIELILAFARRTVSHDH